IQVLYPSQFSSVVCTSQNYPNCEKIQIFSKQAPNLATQSAIVLACRKVSKEDSFQNKCDIARLSVRAEDFNA
ncbi:hypothetical protein KBD68_04670, partial [Candidatus Woesebacteria bacterium]|nr:hypothetical protein [Candidatus Woesebacteria bacterium]